MEEDRDAIAYLGQPTGHGPVGRLRYRWMDGSCERPGSAFSFFVRHMFETITVKLSTKLKDTPYLKPLYGQGCPLPPGSRLDINVHKIYLTISIINWSTDKCFNTIQNYHIILLNQQEII